MESLINRFMKYVTMETTSDEDGVKCPTTEGQMRFAQQLVEELKSIGAQEISLDENGYVMATIPANTDKEVPVIGFISHMDTSPEASGKNVKPQIVRFSGSDILINKEKNISLSMSDFPETEAYLGQDVIVSDGTTLLGADDKAGIAEIMTMTENLLKDNSIPHGKIRIAFTPDEEIGRGADLFNVEQFGAQWAYTVDGGVMGEIQYENFNAAVAEIHITGRNVHPGEAKGKMINASRVAAAIQSSLPFSEVPERTEGYEGFFHTLEMNCSPEKGYMKMLIRDHDLARFEYKKELLKKNCEIINMQYGCGGIEVKIRDQYFNMKEKIVPNMHIVDIAKEAMLKCNVIPQPLPIRGGTDGATLSFKGLPCPNIFTGGMNFHSRFEYIPVNSMIAAVNVLTEICKIVAK